MIKRTLYHFHFCCGLGGGAAGFNRARPRVGNVEAEWVCLGGIDVDPAGLRDFERLAGVPGTLLDLFTRDQYVRFHGKEPPAGWREATPEDIRRAAGGRRPDAVFISSPCKGASGLLSEKMSLTPKYQALNELTLRCIWLMGEAWADDPVPLIVFENVPRLASRGRHLLDQINSLLGGFGYAVAETTHDCGELGGLAQSRKRFLLVARHVEKVPPFLYEPEKKSLRAVGGYTTNLDEAETFTLARAVRQYECRETDLPWPVDYVRARAELGVDHQDLDLSRTQALAGAPADDRIYVAYDRDWDGNCLVWVPEAAGRTSNLTAARTWPLDHAGILTARGLAPWPKSYIDQHARPVAVAASLNHKQALRLFGLKLPKPEHQGRLALAKEGEA